MAYVRRRAPDELVDDVVAETFLVAWRRVDRVPAEPLPWLFGVARNVIATQLRSAARRRRLDLRLRDSRSSNGGADKGQEIEGPLTTALAHLPAKDREALMLVAWEGLSPRQAAAALGEASTTFRARLYRARRRIKGHLARGESVEPASPPPPKAKESVR
jgi:RNA polymerase sigma factor (sigma-70 family)